MSEKYSTSTNLDPDVIEHLLQQGRETLREGATHWSARAAIENARADLKVKINNSMVTAYRDRVLALLPALRAITDIRNTNRKENKAQPAPERKLIGVSQAFVVEKYSDGSIVLWLEKDGVVTRSAAFVPVKEVA